MADASAAQANVTALATAAGKLVKVETDAIRASSSGGDPAAAPKHADRIDRILQKLAQVAQQPSATPMPAQQAEQALQP